MLCGNNQNNSDYGGDQTPPHYANRMVYRPYRSNQSNGLPGSAGLIHL